MDSASADRPRLLAFPDREQRQRTDERRRRTGPDPLWRELVGEVLRASRTDQRRTLQQVARRAGISPQYLSEVERGVKEPSSEMLGSICGALELTLDELLTACSMRLIGVATFAGPVLRLSGPGPAAGRQGAPARPGPSSAGPTVLALAG